jgi:pimeloyl-ACP methyl ester carboxylesterase
MVSAHLSLVPWSAIQGEPRRGIGLAVGYRNSPHAQNAAPEQVQAMREVFRQRVGRWPAEFDAAQAAANLKIPVLVVHDERDPMVPFGHGAAYVSAIPNARLIRTNGKAVSRQLTRFALTSLITLHSPACTHMN